MVLAAEEAGNFPKLLPIPYNVSCMCQFTAVVQERRSCPFVTRTLVGEAGSAITSQLLGSGMAGAKVIENKELHPLARKKISVKDVVYFMEQIENPLFLGM